MRPTNQTHQDFLKEGEFLSRCPCGETITAITPGLQIECDPFWIRMLVVNLLTNACKFGMENPIEITVGTSVDRKRSRAFLEVRDHGTDGNTHSGLGLGLFIV